MNVFRANNRAKLFYKKHFTTANDHTGRRGRLPLKTGLDFRLSIIESPREFALFVVDPIGGHVHINV